MTWINRKNLSRLVGAIVVMWLLVFFAFDPVLKYALTRAGAKAAGAKVDIASVKSRWLRGRLDVSGLAVADKNSLMKNIVESSRLGFTLDVGAALRGKAVIREASIEGLRFGTPRKTNGALPHPPPPSPIEAAVREKLGDAGAAVVGGTPDVKANAVAAVDSAKLQSLKKLDEAKAKAREIEERWKAKQAEAAQIAKDAQQISDDVKSLGRGNLLQNAQKISQTQKKIKELIGRVDAQRDQAKKDLAQIEGLYAQAEDLRRKDVHDLLSAAGMPSFDTQDLAKRLLGAHVAARLGTTLHWMKWAREKAEARKKTAAGSPPPPPRRKGVTIEFPRAHSYPQFLLENAKLAGTLDGLYRGRALDVTGVLSGVTSNPVLYGKPATLTLSGKAASGEAVNLAAEIQQQQDPVGIVLRFEGAGFPLAGASLGDGQVGGALSDGQARVSGEIRSVGDEWKGEIAVIATDVKLQPKVALAGLAGQAVSDALRSIDGFQARIGLAGTEENLKLAFSSNIGEILAGAMRKAFSGQIESQRKRVEAKIAELYGPQLRDARGATNGLAAKLLGPWDNQRADLDRQLQDTLKKSIGGAPNFKKLFK